MAVYSISGASEGISVAWFSPCPSIFVTGLIQVGRCLEVNQLSARNVSFSNSAQTILSTPSRCAKHLDVIRLLTEKKNDRPLSFPYKQITIQDNIFMTSTLPAFLAPGWVLYLSGRKKDLSTSYSAYYC